MDQADIDRFFSKVSSEPDENGCLSYGSLGGLKVAMANSGSKERM
jgi:hypothetical protein